MSDVPATAAPRGLPVEPVRVGVRDSLAVALLGFCVMLAICRDFLPNAALAQYRAMSAGIDSLAKTAASLRSSVAPGTEEIGYVSDQDFRAFTVEAISANFFYFGLQYQLLPAMLVPSAAPETVVCHLRDRSNLDQILRRNRLVLRSELENGYFLLKHGTP